MFNVSQRGFLILALERESVVNGAVKRRISNARQVLIEIANTVREVRRRGLNKTLSDGARG